MGLREFRDVVAGRRGRLKPTLMDQSVIAGLGHLLVDESAGAPGYGPSFRLRSWTTKPSRTCIAP
jgi:formamidopyrimidine-DNA glycosylase